jgi:hypothetical protein
MQAFRRTFRAEEAEFAASLTHGFGAPETSSPEDSQEETKSGLQHGNQAAFEVPTSLFTPEKKTLQPVHPITPVQVEINRKQYLTSRPFAELGYQFDFSRVKKEDLEPGSKLSPRDFEAKIEKLDDDGSSEARPSAM